MGRDSDDRMVLIGEAWIWLSDVIAITPVGHKSNFGLAYPEGTRSVVAVESLNILLYDVREPQALVLDILGIK